MPQKFNGIRIEFEGDIKNPTLTPEYRHVTIMYPLNICSESECSPYKITLQRGIYQFECWGAKGTTLYEGKKPGLGAYTSGVIKISDTQIFYVYIGATGFFNAIIERNSSINGPSGSGGATDVRLEKSEHWWDTMSLASRIMVAAGGGSAEWEKSIGGNGGTIEGGTAFSDYGTSTDPGFDHTCLGANQTSSRECSTIINGNRVHTPTKGEFGYAWLEDLEADTGGFGGSGYYGGTSYPWAYAGSGGSSFISGHDGCLAIKDPSKNNDQIIHKEDSIHYSGITFTQTKMIEGNQTMPHPSGYEGIWNDDNGAFRITYLLFKKLTCKKQRYSTSGTLVLMTLADSLL